MFTANLKHDDTQIQLIKLEITKFTCAADINFHKFSRKFMARKLILIWTFAEKC
jgi:hypothetical protein